MKKQSGYLHYCAQHREAVKAAIAAAHPDMPAGEKNQAIMTKFGSMWGALDAAAKQRYADAAPLVAVKPPKPPKPATSPKLAKLIEAAGAPYRSNGAQNRAADAPAHPSATMEGLALPAKPTDWPKELGQALRAARAPCAFVSPNPKRARGNVSNSVLDYDQYMTAATVDEFFARKGNWGHLKYDVQRGYCTLDAAQLDACWRSVRGGVAPKAARAPKKRISEEWPGGAPGEPVVVEGRTRKRPKRVVFDPSAPSPEAIPPPPKPVVKRQPGPFVSIEEILQAMPEAPLDGDAFARNFAALSARLDACVGCAAECVVARVALEAGAVIADPGTFVKEGTGDTFEVVGGACFAVARSRTRRLVRGPDPNIGLEASEGRLAWRLLKDVTPGAPLVARVATRRPAPPAPPVLFVAPEAVAMVIDDGAPEPKIEQELLPRPEKEKFLAPTAAQQAREPKLPPKPLKRVDPRPRRAYGDVDRVRWIAGLYADAPPPEDFDAIVRVPSLFLPCGGLGTPSIAPSGRPRFNPHQFLAERYFELPEDVRRPVMCLDWHTEAWVARRAERRRAALAHRVATGRNAAED